MSPTIGIVERMRWMSALVASAVLTVGVIIALSVVGKPLTAPVAAPASDAAGSPATLDPRIGTLAARHPSRVVEAIVQFKAGVTAAAQRADVARVGGRITGNLHIINGYALRLTASNAGRLASSADVHAVTLNTAIAPQDAPESDDLDTTFNQTLGAPALWHFGAGLTGKGIGVAVIDTGIDGDLPDFRDSSGKLARDRHRRHQPRRDHGDGHLRPRHPRRGDHRRQQQQPHAGDPLRGKYVGVAPDANLVSVKVSDDAGNATVLDVIYGLQFVVDHKDDLQHPRRQPVARRRPRRSPTRLDPLDAAVESAWFHGHRRRRRRGQPWHDPDAVAVRARPTTPTWSPSAPSTTNGTTAPRDDEIADWSSRGTTQDGFDKPDVTAPGAHIVSVLAPNSAFASQCPSCIVDGQYISAGGTSMAAPMVSGAGRGHAAAAPQLDSRPGQGCAEQPADQVQPGDRRGQRAGRGAAAVCTGGRQGPDAEHAAEGQERTDRLQPLHLEPLPVEPGSGQPRRGLRPVELELHLWTGTFGGR